MSTQEIALQGAVEDLAKAREKLKQAAAALHDDQQRAPEAALLGEEVADIYVRVKALSDELVPLPAPQAGNGS